MTTNTANCGPQGGLLRAVLYTRVSTEEQTRGYSLRQQLDALREYASAHGYEIAEEVEDAGYSGAYLERPGLDRVRDLVQGGAVSLVLAQDADRITRNPYHRGHLDEEFARYGAELRALDDWGDDSHEGSLLKFIRGWQAQGERLKTAERTRRGRLRKAREGRVIGDSKPNYGYRLNATRDGYEVEESEMRVVRRVFAMLASGSAVNAVVKTLRREGVPSPSGGPASSWSHSQIRNLVFSEVYRPHGRAELEGLVGEGLMAREVLDRLDPGSAYGVWWFNQRRHERERTRERREDGSYKERHTRTAKDRREWVAVPVPGAGVPEGHVRRARERLSDNSRPSRAGGRFWELAGGGLLRCGECGGGMRARTVKRKGRGERPAHTDFYYTCNAAFRRDGRCSHSTVYPADAVEREVVRLVDDLLADPERLMAELDEAIEREERTLRDPDGEAAAWAARLGELERLRARNQEMYRADAMTLDELRAELGRLDEAREAAEEELGRAREAAGRLAGLRAQREAALEMFGVGLALGLMWFPPALRRQVYEAFGLRAVVVPGGPLGPGYGPNVEVEGWLDAGTWRFTEELAAFVRALQEADERLRETPYDGNIPASVERLERELAAARAEARDPSAIGEGSLGGAPSGQRATSNSHGSLTSSRKGAPPLASLSFNSPGAMLL